MPSERLQKILSRAGLGSRRACEELIEAGRVTVNGVTATLGMKADPDKDRILFDGRPVTPAEAPIYIAIYKPRGVISAVSSPDVRSTVRDLVPLEGHFYPVGRLDVDSEGLILLTNDGDLANRLTHPRYGHEKEYRVLVARRPDEKQLETWRRGVVMEDGYRTAPAEVRVESLAGKGTWLRVVMREGRKRQIRETGFLIGLPVVKIIRVRIGTLNLGNLKPREWRRLTTAEVQSLQGKPGPGLPPAPPARRRTAKPRADSSGAGPRPGRTSDRPGRAARPGRTSERSEAPSRPGRTSDRSESAPRSGRPTDRSESPPRSSRPAGRPERPKTSGQRPPRKPGDSPGAGKPYKKKPRSRG